MEKSKLDWQSTPISTLKGIGPQKAKRFAVLGIRTLDDLMCHWPLRYEDRSNVMSLAQAKDGERCAFKIVVTAMNKHRISKGDLLIKVSIDDGSGRGTMFFKDAPYMMQQFEIGQSYWIYGSVRISQGKVSLFHPEVKSHAQHPEGMGIVPIYALTEGLTQNDLLKAMMQLKGNIHLTDETLPESVLSGIMSRAQSVYQLHFPASAKLLKAARYRLVYEEFFHLQMALILVRQNINRILKRVPYQKVTHADIRALFPFELTSAQKRVIEEIYSDMDSEHCMNRLLQGDVGSGKTAVAIAAAYKAIVSGYQVAVLAPTEILAKQHAVNFERGLGTFAKVALLTGNVKGKARLSLLAEVAEGKIQVVVGTHALIQDSVVFKQLKLVVTDEQHRFGVSQRQMATEKGTDPLDVLVMSATPIPRTLSLIIYGDVDMSVLDELPMGRQAIETHWIRTKKLPDLITFMKGRLAEGERVYWIAPLIETQEELDLKSLEALYSDLRPHFDAYGIGILHGRLSGQDKSSVMDQFASGELGVLVATTVVEVGVDVPEATVMAIYHAERFGLSQLHQLRGRVGRSHRKSYCYLISDSRGEIAKERLSVMTKTNDGFEIANKDLALRGPGEMIGLRQHGVPEFKVADLIKHASILAQVQKDARTYAEYLASGAEDSPYLRWLSTHLTL